MTLPAVVNPYQPLVGLNGIGVSDGGLYIGVAGQDPDTHPQACYWDPGGTIPAFQPIQVLGGYPMRLGTPAQVFTAQTYSIRLRDATDSQVFYVANASSVTATTPQEVGIYLSRLDLRASTVAANVDMIYVGGRNAYGDGMDCWMKRVGAQPPHNCWDQSADGAYWEYMRDARGVKANAASKNAVASDAAYNTATDTMTGTDSWQGVQDAIDFALYYKIGVVYQPSGKYLLSKPFQTGYAALSTLHFVGDGRVYRGEPSFGGTAFFCNFSNAPGIVFQACRQSSVEDMTFVGKNYAPLLNAAVLGPTPTFNDRIVGNWIGGTLDPNAGSRYTPYAAVAVDPYSGVQPATHYPNVVYPAWLTGAQPQYGKDQSGQVAVRRVSWHGFVAGVVIQPANDDANGDYITIEDCLGEYTPYQVAPCNSQGRKTLVKNCVLGKHHTAFANAVFGTQNGQMDLLCESCDISGGIQWMNLPLGTVAGATTFINCYGENIWRIGDFGQNERGTSPLTFISCAFNFSAQTNARGKAPTLLGASDTVRVGFKGCTFRGYGRAGIFSGPANGYWFEDCVANNDAVTQPYEKFAVSFLGGGLVLQPTDVQQFPEIFSVSVVNSYNVDTGAAEGRRIGQACASDRSHPVCAWSKQGRAMNQQSATFDTPSPWSAVDRGTLSSCTLVANQLTIVFTGGTDQVFTYAGRLPGCPVIDFNSGSVFLIHSRIGNTLIAELVTNYTLVGGVYTPINAISMGAGLLWFGNALQFVPEWFLRGDVSNASPDLTNCARDDGYGSWIGADNQILVGDYAYVDELRDRWISASRTLVTAIVNGDPATITLNGNGARNTTIHALPWWIRQPPANV